MNKKILFLLFTAIFLTSCVVNQDEYQKTKNDLYNLNNYTVRLSQRLTALENRVNNLDEKIDKMDTSIKATQKLQYNELSSDLESIKNQLNDIKSFDQTSSNQNYGNNTEVAEVTKEAIKDIYSKIYSLEKEVNNLKNDNPSTFSKKKPVNTEGAFYKHAYTLFTAGKYSQAENAFKDFIKRYPKSSLIPNAYYWLGECFYKRKMYEKAIINYDEIIVKYPKSRKVPAALLKEGLAFLRIGEKDGAKLIFRKILRDYPKSSQATYAKKYLRKLK